jgi:hypothetical protein
MSHIKLFRIGTGTVDELTGTTETIEKSVQVRSSRVSRRRCSSKRPPNGYVAYFVGIFFPLLVGSDDAPVEHAMFLPLGW